MYYVRNSATCLLLMYFIFKRASFWNHWNKTYHNFFPGTFHSLLTQLLCTVTKESKTYTHYWKGMTRKKVLILENFHQTELLQVSQMVLTPKRETQNVHYIIYSLVIFVKSKFQYRQSTISLLKYVVYAIVN